MKSWSLVKKKSSFVSYSGKLLSVQLKQKSNLFFVDICSQKESIDWDLSSTVYTLDKRAIRFSIWLKNWLTIVWEIKTIDINLIDSKSQHMITDNKC